MAHVANDSADRTPRPCMDRLTHAVLKETSKSLKYYIDVKRRENAFVLNTNPSTCDLTPLRTKFIYRTTGKHPSLSSSYYVDEDIKSSLPNLQQKQLNTTSTSPEKQMCREELHFHMRSYNFSSRENSKFSELRLRRPIRLNSSFNTTRDIRSRSAFKLKRHEQNQLIDNTADLLALMVKSRRSFYETNSSTQQTSPMYLLRNTNCSSRQTDEQSGIQSSTTGPRTLPIKKEKSKTKDFLTTATSIMQKSKPIHKGILCDYKISITTGNCNGASTDARIRIKVYGTNGHTNFHDLAHSEIHHVPFLKDQTDVFTVQTYHVGDLVGITIGHDRKDMRAGWFLSKISIDDPICEVTYDIPCNAWLSIKSNDKKTMRDFQVVSMVSHKKKNSSNEHREENESQSGYSRTSTGGTVTSDGSNLSKNNLLIDHKKVKNHRKQQQQHVSIDSATIAEEPLSTSTNGNNLSQSPPTIATAETLSNQDEVPNSPPALAHRLHTPIVSTTSSDTEIEDNVTDQSRSTTATPSPTLNQTRLKSVFEHDTLPIKSTNNRFQRYSIDYDRPPTRLEQRSSPLTVSPERPNKNNEEE